MKEPFRSSLLKTVYNPEFQQASMKAVYYYYAFFWVVIVLINIFVAYNSRNADLLILCVLWIYFAYKNLKVAREQSKIIKEQRNLEIQ